MNDRSYAADEAETAPSGHSHVDSVIGRPAGPEWQDTAFDTCQHDTTEIVEWCRQCEGHRAVTVRDRE